MDLLVGGAGRGAYMSVIIIVQTLNLFHCPVPVSTHAG